MHSVNRAKKDWLRVGVDHLILWGRGIICGSKGVWMRLPLKTQLEEEGRGGRERADRWCEDGM